MLLAGVLLGTYTTTSSSRRTAELGLAEPELLPLLLGWYSNMGAAGGPADALLLLLLPLVLTAWNGVRLMAGQPAAGASTWAAVLPPSLPPLLRH
jgi:hypothetical protein